MAKYQRVMPRLPTKEESRMLKAYMVHDGEPEDRAALVFARTAQEARKLGAGWNDVGCGDFLTADGSSPCLSFCGNQGNRMF